MASKPEKNDIVRGILCRLNTQLIISTKKIETAIKKKSLSQLVSALMTKHAMISASLEIWDMEEVRISEISDLLPSC